MPSRKKIQIGEKYGSLMVIENDLLIVSGGRNKYACKCVCDCGNVVEAILETSLRSGNTIACGCAQPKAARKVGLAQRKYLTPLEASQRGVFSTRYNDGDLLFEDFILLTQDNCIYCECSPSNEYNSSRLKNSSASFIYNGLDRIDSSQPHNISNVIASCKYCNIAKHNLSLLEFLAHIVKMYHHRNNVWNGDYSLVCPPILIGKTIIIHDFHPIPQIIREGEKVGKLTIISKTKRKSWVCRCECGKKKIEAESTIKNGHAKTCGSPECTSIFSPQISALRQAWADYKKDGITFEEFFELTQMNCFYCNKVPSNIITCKLAFDNNKYYYNGLDRINSDLSHTIDNVVPCCHICNIMKNDRSIKDFDVWVANVFSRINIINNNLLPKLAC